MRRGLLRRLFGNKEQEQNVTSASVELAGLRELNALMDKLLAGDHYVPRSEYAEMIEEYSRLPGWFSVLRDSGTLDVFCRNNGTSDAEIHGIISRYEAFPSLIDLQNEQYVKSKMASEKEYLDNILKDSDPNILLDDDQRRVVLTDEDYCLVVAGAGAGKTTTVAAKVKYLVDKQGIDPKQILVISFTNKAVNELKQRIIGDLHIECPIATFHSTGNAILRKQNPAKLNSS